MCTTADIAPPFNVSVRTTVGVDSEEKLVRRNLPGRSRVLARYVEILLEQSARNTPA